MKKMLISIALATLLPVAAQAQMKYNEGQDYVTLPAQIVPLEQPTITEFFWFGCPGCYSVYEPFTTWIKEKKAENVVVVKVPAMPSPNWAVGGQLYYTAEALGLDMDKFEAAAFDEFHKKGNRGAIVDPKKAQEFLATQEGVDAAAVEKAWNSFAVKQKMESARQLFANSGLDATPSFLVNGRYAVAVQRNYDRTFDILQTLALSKPYKAEGGEAKEATKAAESAAQKAPAEAAPAEAAPKS